MKSLITFILCLMIFLSCGDGDTLDLNVYEEWQADRIAYLTKPLGYMSLAGLYWLEEGDSSFGSSVNNSLIFPEKAPGQIGVIIRTGDDFTVEFNDELEVKLDSVMVSGSRIETDAEGKPSMMNWESLYWYVIRRGDRYGIRLKDTLSEERQNLKSIPTYSPCSEWIIPAQFVEAGPEDSVAVTNAVGSTTNYKLEGELIFHYKGEDYNLKATNGGAEDYFVVFGDLSNNANTYGGGRFLYVARADNNGETVMDFNKSVNPICALNEFAVCPLPPEGNALPFAIHAGEKDPKKY